MVAEEFLALVDVAWAQPEILDVTLKIFSRSWKTCRDVLVLVDNGTLVQCRQWYRSLIDDGLRTFNVKKS